MDAIEILHVSIMTIVINPASVMLTSLSTEDNDKKQKTGILEDASMMKQLKYVYFAQASRKIGVW
jgi:hypothetical protein